MEEPVTAVACPRCGRELDGFRVAVRRNGWGRRPGAPPHTRPENWWRCAGCGWLGCQNRGDGPIRPMRRLTGAESDCFFCGEEESNVASEPWDQDGERRDWIVCLVCGTSNQRRLG